MSELTYSQRRQTQNREAQRAFRIRQRQRLEDLEKELHSLRSKYENLQEKYAGLHLLYMQRVNVDGGMWTAGGAGTVGSSGSAGSFKIAERGVRTSPQIVEKGREGSQHLEFQQADVAAWLSATGEVN